LIISREIVKQGLKSYLGVVFVPEKIGLFPMASHV